MVVVRCTVSRCEYWTGEQYLLVGSQVVLHVHSVRVFVLGDVSELSVDYLLTVGGRLSTECSSEAIR
jgi:hypothetical protein